MTQRFKWGLVIVAAVVLIGGALAYGVTAFVRFEARTNAPSEVDSVALDRVEPGQVLFRSTAAGEDYGLLAAVPADDPAAPRAVHDLACDRVDATSDYVSCLRTIRGIVTTFEWQVTDAAFDEVWSVPLPGVPSRTRIADDSRYWASTAFVTGHSYATIDFSTATVITGADGTEHGNLEGFDFTVNGAALTSADRNFWGVTFVPGGDEFYATAASGGRTWLVRGDVGDRTLVAIRDGVECPSISPDGTRIAFKQVAGTAPETRWTIAVLDLATGRETVLPEHRNVDDQVEWLDDDTLLYGMPRDGAAGESDVWAVAADGSNAPVLFIAHGSSPSVVR
ncbi:hypothetical protein DCE93_12180 [Agromyces badenianii]|uniref:TolB-like translocation protein n=1 Tax=Agromyces badenianii TaxID=2080742 RepID=A0A2S0WY81_9MICO|nr:hypothetical protein [Agromyces badenianii]AWB96313.1 hypothetical protein DCE93_12180 [Agromyces badenianii]